MVLKNIVQCENIKIIFESTIRKDFVFRAPQYTYNVSKHNRQITRYCQAFKSPTFNTNTPWYGNTYDTKILLLFYEASRYNSMLKVVS